LNSSSTHLEVVNLLGDRIQLPRVPCTSLSARRFIAKSSTPEPDSRSEATEALRGLTSQFDEATVDVAQQARNDEGFAVRLYKSSDYGKTFKSIGLAGQIHQHDLGVVSQSIEHDPLARSGHISAGSDRAPLRAMACDEAEW
jgi:hypothetical protein